MPYLMAGLSLAYRDLPALAVLLVLPTDVLIRRVFAEEAVLTEATGQAFTADAAPLAERLCAGIVVIGPCPHPGRNVVASVPGHRCASPTDLRFNRRPGHADTRYLAGRRARPGQPGRTRLWPAPSGTRRCRAWSPL